jgi:hypothetical protein
VTEQCLGTPYSAAFLAAMLQEGGRVESEHRIALSLSDWIFTYINL